MGGRYGASSDGSSDYQSRRPNSTDTDAEDRTDAQQTIAEAVRSVQERRQSGSTQRSTSASSGGGGSDTHDTSGAATTASVSLAAATTRLVNATIDVDERIADVVASSVVTQIQDADERIIEDDDGWLL